MTPQSATTDASAEVKYAAKANNTARFTAPDRTAPAPTAASRPTVNNDDDSQWVTQRMFDHYNG